MALGVDNPLGLLAIFPVVIMLIYFWRKQKSLSVTRKIVIITLRGIVLLLIILAVAGTQLLWSVQETSTIFVVDQSTSVNKQEQKLITYINEAISSKRVEDKFGIVTVGADASIERPLTNRESEVVDFQAIVEPGFTNLASGLQLAGSLFSDTDRGRIVMMSDGNENIGDSKKQAAYLKRQGYIVDVVAFSPLKGIDIAVNDLEVPTSTYVGEKVNMSLDIYSNISTSSHVTIYQDNEPILQEDISVNQGSTNFTFSYIIKDPGFHTYKAEIVADVDTILENNLYYAFSETKGIPSVLIVEGNDGEALNISSVLKNSFVNVKVISPELLPTNIGAYLNYDSIVFSNVSAPRVTGHQMELIERAVHDFGVGFIMTGGNESFGLGGYFKTPIEDLLPVKMEVKGENELPSLGLIVVLDRSGSMSGDKMDLAREAAARSVELLREKDILGLIAFDSQPWQIIETGPIKNKENTLEKIRSITSDGGTDIFPALQLAYDQLMDLSLKRKHIILLTDGQSPVPSDYQEMIEFGKQKNITISTVAVGHEADTGLLDEIATIGGGRFYYVVDASTIPTVFSRETSLLTKTYIVDEPFYPKLVNGYEWNDILQGGIPQLNAYIATTPKERANQVLISEKEDPVLIRWQYGLGKAIAWTSDTKEWAGNWPIWKNWPTFWNELLTWTFPQYTRQPYEVETTIVGNTITIDVVASNENTTNVEALLVSSEGEETALSLHIKAPGEFKGTFTTNNPGIFYLQLSEKEGEKTVGTFKTGIVVPYSQEFKFDKSNLTLLEEVAEAGGGRVIEHPKDIFRNDLPSKNKKQDIFYPLLILALLIFLLDVAARRFHFSPAIFSKFSNEKNQKKKTAMMELEKQQSQFQQLKKATVKRREPQKGIEDTKKNLFSLDERDKEIKENRDNRDSVTKKNDPIDRQEQMDRLLKARKRK